MLVKSYWSSWILFSIMAGIFLMVGSFSMVVAVVFGLIAFGLVFAGMMCVLPGEVSHMAVKQIKVLAPNRALINDTTSEKSQYNEWRSDRSREKVTLHGKIDVETKIAV